MRTRSKPIFSTGTLPFLLAGCAGAAGDPGTVTTGSSEPVGQTEEALTLGFTPVPNANTKAPGLSSATRALPLPLPVPLPLPRFSSKL